jgi:outer membrane protein, multidrug efflux system
MGSYTRSSTGGRELLMWVLAASVALAHGCALKSPPDAAALKADALDGMQVPSAWTATAMNRVAPADNWLASFADPQLSEAVGEAMVRNADLRVGAARVEQSLLEARLAGARLYPSVDVLARGGGKLSGDNSGLTGASLAVGWELDLWGRVRYGRAAP